MCGKPLSLILAFPFLLVAAQSSAAEVPPEVTVQALLTNCKAVSGPNPGLSTDANFCLGYISGVGDYLKGMGLAGTNPALSICGDISYGAAVQAFINWGQKHPEHWQENRLFGVVLALRELWPCPTRGTQP